MMYRAMHLANALRIKAGLLKLPVNVAGEDEASGRHACQQSAQHTKTGVRRSVTVQGQPVPIETPRQTRIPIKIVRAGNFFKAHARPSQRRIFSPEPLRPAKIGHSGIHTHTGTRRNQQTISLSDQLGCTRKNGLDIVRVRIWFKYCSQCLASPCGYLNHGC